MKNILLLFTILLSSCADTITTKNLSVTHSIPDVWKHSIPQPSEVTGKWWEAFQDTILNKVFTEFNSNSPDLKSIASRLEMARQAYKINIAPRLPAASLGLSGSSRLQNLTAFGLLRKIAEIPDDFVKVSESGISSIEAIIALQPYGYKGFLIGENFMKTDDPGASATEFIKQLTQ